MAELNGEYSEEDKTALIVGNYLHSYFENQQAHQAFVEEHKWDIFKTKKATKADKAKKLDKEDRVVTHSLNATFTQAFDMICALSSDHNFCKSYQGNKEVIVTGQIGGIDWKGKVDCLNLKHHFFIDLKTTQQLNRKYWNVDENGWDSFVAHWNYQLQMYVYQQLIYQTYGVLCTPYIIAVTKEKIPDKAIISIPETRMMEAKEQVYDLQDHIEDVRHGLVKPERCGTCDYCKLTKQLGDIISMDDLIE